MGLIKWGRLLRPHSWPCACFPSGDVSIGIKCAPGVVGPAEADIDFDIIKNDNDTFTVKYTPPGAGRYTIMVLFANQVPHPRLWPSPVACTLRVELTRCHVGTSSQPSTGQFSCAGSVLREAQRAGALSEAASAYPHRGFLPSRRSLPAPSILRWTHPMMPARSRLRALG